MSKQNFKSVTCPKCRRVHFGVSLSYANAEVDRFNKYYRTLDRQTQLDNYGGKPATLKSYLFCGCGTSYKMCRESKDGDCPSGVTINPILHYSEVIK